MGDDFLAYFQRGAGMWWCFEHSSIVFLFREASSGFLGSRGRRVDLFCKLHLARMEGKGWLVCLVLPTVFVEESIWSILDIQVLFISSEDYGFREKKSHQLRVGFARSRKKGKGGISTISSPPFQLSNLELPSLPSFLVLIIMDFRCGTSFPLLI